MNPLPTRHALLRDRTGWDGERIGLALDEDGVASLLPLPAVPAPVALPGPFEVPLSGLACAPCAGAFVADTANHQVVYDDGLCRRLARVPPVAKPGAAPGEFDRPRGLAFAPGRGLYVADSGNARVVLLRDPSLETVAILTQGLTEPRALALDGGGRLYVVDGAAGTIVRFLPSGTYDAIFAAAMAAHGIAARAIAIGADGTLYVSTSTGAIRRFDPAGAALADLEMTEAGFAAGAIAASGALLYAADLASGAVAVLDRASGRRLAWLPRFLGPVAAMAACEDGTLLVKTGDDAPYLRCPPLAVAAEGSVEAGPLDAGERDAWHVAMAEGQVPERTSLRLFVFAGEDATVPPGAADWVEAPADSVRIANLFPGVAARFLWLRVVLQSADNLATPRLAQVRAETPGEDYLDQLPALYRNADGEGHFLGRLLDGLRVQFDRSERVIDSLALRTAIDFAPAADLDWIAAWLGFDLPAGLGSDERRTLLHRVVPLYDRRWTAAGLAELVHVYTGVRPRVIEAWRDRHLWQLGVDSALGFDTGLAPADPAGLVVPDIAPLEIGEPAFDCAVPGRVTVGSAVVGASGPLARSEFGAPLFADSAHRFIVAVPAGQARQAPVREAIRGVIEREKPAHTDYDLCFVEPAMRVGLQSLLGIDTYVADRPAGSTLAGMTLDLDAYLAATDGAGRVGSQAELGRGTRLA